MRKWLTAAVVSLLFAMPAFAETAEERAESLMLAFVDSALWRGAYHEFGTPVTRWSGPIRLSSNHPLDDKITIFAVETIKRLGVMANVPVEVLARDNEKANYHLEFLDGDSVGTAYGGQGAPCMTTWQADGNGNHLSVRLQLSLWPKHRPQLENCIRHEAMHGMGLHGHPHALDSVLSYVYTNGRADYTDNDEMLLKLLYAQTLKPGMYQLPALKAVQDELVHRLGIASGKKDGIGRKAFDLTRERMAKAAEEGNAAMQVQLAVAYIFGQMGEKQPDKAIPWLRKAASADNSEGQFRLGVAYHYGQGIAVDKSEAARWYKLAISKGHSMALNNLGVLYRDGAGVATDRTEAWALFDLAGKKGNDLGNANRGKLEPELTTEQLAEARRRQEKWTGKAGANP